MYALSQTVSCSQSLYLVYMSKKSERGLLGIAVENSAGQSRTVFLYYTESAGNEIRNRVYRYASKLQDRPRTG